MTLRRLILSLALVASGLACEKKDEDPSAKPSAAESPTSAKGEVKTSAAGAPNESALVAEVGVEPGGIARDAKDGAAVVSEVKGTVEVRRLGEETYGPIAKGEALYEGDLLRTQLEASAQVTLADQTLIELPEVSAIAIGDRSATAAPALAVATLSGAARFTVSPRVKGEGSLVIFTPGAIVHSGEGIFAVAIAADGRARVGVEKGTIELIGAASMDAPVKVPAGMAVIVAVNGQLAAPARFEVATWGAWRDEADASLDAKATVTAHGAALASLRGELSTSWGEMDAHVKDPDVSASFRLAERAQFQTWALVGHGYLATEIYIRHPEVEVVYTPIQAQVAASLLYPKKLHVVAHGWLMPARAKANIDMNAHAKVKLTPVAWYVRPPTLKSQVLVGIEPSVRLKAVFVARPVVPIAQIRVSGAAAFGAGANVGAGAAIGAGGAVEAAGLEAHGAAVEVHGKVGGAAVKVKKMEADVKGQVKGAVGAGVSVGAHAGAQVKKAAAVEVKAPEVKPPAVKGKVGVKGEVKAKGGFSIGGGN